MFRLSIVIPTLGRSPSLRDVLVGLDNQKPRLEDAEIIVVVDSSVSTPQWLDDEAQRRRALKVLQATSPGASSARNAGWRAAASDVVLFLDDDIVPARRLVAEHLGLHRRKPEPQVAVLGVVRWSRKVRVTPFMRWLESGVQFDFDSIRKGEVDWWRFYSCNVSVKREMLERVCGFDERRFPFGYEDLDVARRMSEHGLRLLFNPSALGEHMKTETLESWRQKLERIAVSERRFVTVYPTERPYFYERFLAASRAPHARGRSARLARLVGPRVPWLGQFVWKSFDLVCSQALAPDYLERWDAAGADLLSAPADVHAHARNGES
jgi:GT2 family glycosyltransferase